jgi:peptidoglycan hydrolase CwlO-like protein
MKNYSKILIGVFSFILISVASYAGSKEPDLDVRLQHQKANLEKLKTWVAKDNSQIENDTKKYGAESTRVASDKGRLEKDQARITKAESDIADTEKLKAEGK